MAANRLPASWMNALDPAAGARPSRLTAARTGAPRCPYISRRSRPASGQTLTVPSSLRRAELPRPLRAPLARNVIPGAHACVRARDRSCVRVMNRRTFVCGMTLGALARPLAADKSDPVSLDTVWTTMTAAKEAGHEGQDAKAN